MSTPMRFLRHLLFLPCGNPKQQDKDVRAVEHELKQGRERVKIARATIENAHKLRELMNEVLEKTK